MTATPDHRPDSWNEDRTYADEASSPAPRHIAAMLQLGECGAVVMLGDGSGATHGGGAEPVVAGRRQPGMLVAAVGGDEPLSDGGGGAVVPLGRCDVAGGRGELAQAHVAGRQVMLVRLEQLFEALTMRSSVVDPQLRVHGLGPVGASRSTPRAHSRTLGATPAAPDLGGPIIGRRRRYAHRLRDLSQSHHCPATSAGWNSCD